MNPDVFRQRTRVLSRNLTVLSDKLNQVDALFNARRIDLKCNGGEICVDESDLLSGLKLALEKEAERLRGEIRRQIQIGVDIDES